MPTAVTVEQANTEGNMSAALRKENGHGYEIVPSIPKPSGNPEGKVLDPQGKTVAPAHPTIMARLNERSKDEFTVTKGMAGIIVILLTAFGIFLGYIVPTLRADGAESQKVLGIEREVQETRQDMKELNEKFDKIQTSLGEQALRDAENKGKALGYEVGRTDQKGGH